MIMDKGGGESSSAHIGRAALIPARDSSSKYGRRVKLTYKIRRTATCCIWPIISLYVINDHDACRSTLEEVLICGLIVNVWSVRVSRILELKVEVWLVVCGL